MVEKWPFTTSMSPQGHNIDEKTLDPRVVELVNKIAFELLRCNQHPKRICQWVEKEPEFQGDSPRIVGLKSQIKALEAAVDKLTIEQQTQWTPCSMMLPRLEQEVYIAMSHNNTVWPGYMVELPNNVLRWVKLDDGEHELSMNAVAAWCPRELPVYKPPTPPEHKLVRLFRERMGWKPGSNETLRILTECIKELPDAGV